MYLKRKKEKKERKRERKGRASKQLGDYEIGTSRGFVILNYFLI